MKGDSIYLALTDVFREIFDDDSLVLRPELAAADVKGWDSFKQVEILLAVQERFGLRFSSREIDGLNCVGDLADLIGRKQAT
jgi:acyl carrier protein